MEAAVRLAAEGIEQEPVDPRTFRPLDAWPIIQSICKTGRVLVVHEAQVTGEFGEEIIAQIPTSEAFD